MTGPDRCQMVARALVARLTTRLPHAWVVPRGDLDPSTVVVYSVALVPALLDDTRQRSLVLDQVADELAFELRRSGLTRFAALVPHEADAAVAQSSTIALRVRPECILDDDTVPARLVVDVLGSAARA